QITDLKNFKAGEPSTNASGVRLDKRYEREPIEVQIRAVQDKKKDLQSKLDALYDEARKKGVPSGELPRRPESTASQDNHWHRSGISSSRAFSLRSGFP